MSNKVFKNSQIKLGNPITIECFSETEENDVVDESLGNDNIEDKAEELVRQAENRAQQLTDSARNEAEEIVKQAQAECEKLKEEVLKESTKKGYEDGNNRAVQEHEQLIIEVENIKKKAEDDYLEKLKSLETDVIEMVISSIKKILGDEIENNENYIILLIKQILYKTNSKNAIVVRVSSDDYKYVKSNIEELYKSIDGLDSIEIKKDESLKKGDCIVDTEYGTIDGSIDKQIKKIEEAFKGMVGGD